MNEPPSFLHSIDRDSRAQPSMNQGSSQSLLRSGILPANVTRLQPMRLPAQAACKLPDQSTTLRVESSSTDDPRLLGALPISDMGRVSPTQDRWIDDDIELQRPRQLALVFAYSMHKLHMLGSRYNRESG